MCGCSIHNWHTLSDSSTGLVKWMISLNVAANAVYICSADTMQTLTVSYRPKLSVAIPVYAGCTWCGLQEAAFEMRARLSGWKCWKLCHYDRKVQVSTARLHGFEPPKSTNIQLHQWSLPFPNDNNARNTVDAHTSNSCV